jgi:hypothetical protein
MRDLDDMTGAIVDAAITISMDLGHGHLGSVYEAVLARTLERRGFHIGCARGGCSRCAVALLGASVGMGMPTY